MGRQSIGFVLAAVLVSACSNSTSPSSTTDTTTTATTTTVAVSALAITGGPVFTGLAQRCQLVATATYPDDTTGVVTGSTTWSSSDPSVAVVSPTGVLTTIRAGTAHITALYSAFASGIDISIEPVTTTFQGPVSTSSGEAGSFTLTMKGAWVPADTSTTALVSGSIKVGTHDPYAFSGVFEGTTGSLYLTTPDAPLRISAAIADDAVVGSYTQGDVTGAFSSTSTQVEP